MICFAFAIWQNQLAPTASLGETVAKNRGENVQPLSTLSLGETVAKSASSIPSVLVSQAHDHGPSQKAEQAWVIAIDFLWLCDTFCQD